MTANGRTIYWLSIWTESAWCLEYIPLSCLFNNHWTKCTDVHCDRPAGGDFMEKQKFRIPKISCGHCTMSIKNELEELKGVQSVQGDVADKSITVQWQAPATREQIMATLKEINYPAAE